MSGWAAVVAIPLWLSTIAVTAAFTWHLADGFFSDHDAVSRRDMRRAYKAGYKARADEERE